MISYFSGKDEPVNRELYDFLNGDYFMKSLGVEDPAAQWLAMRDEVDNLENDSNFNPNISSYYTPFTEISVASNSEDTSVNLTQEMLSAFSSTSGGDQLKSIVENLNINPKINNVQFS